MRSTQYIFITGFRFLQSGGENVMKSLKMKVNSAKFVAEGAMKFLLALAIVGGSIVNGFSQIPNASFENWTDNGSIENPSGWFTENVSVPQAVQVPIRAITDAVEGALAVQLENTEAEDGSVIRAMMVSGSDEANHTTGFAYNLRPATLDGYILFQPVETGDSCYIIVEFSEYNPFTHSREIIGQGLYRSAEPMNSWKSFSIPVMYTSTHLPDTATIFCYAGSMLHPQKGSRLQLDHFMFNEVSTGVVIIDGDELGLKVSPNPSGDVIYISNEVVEKYGRMVYVYDTWGKTVIEQELEYSKGIDVSQLEDGEYFLLISDDSGEAIAKASFIVKY